MKNLYSLFKISIITITHLVLLPKVGLAQVTPDNTVNTTVNQNGNVSEITGGQTKGSNLFHSFQDFSVPTGNEAAFNNAQTIENIFSRVTGGNISNIDGAIRANGSANLFLINPAGIIFGENARLDVGGSFIGSTAGSVLFPDGIEFSASDSSAQPILTVNAPIGLGFRDNPGDIVNRAFSFDDGGTPEDLVDDRLTGLEVSANETLSLIGGNVIFEGGYATPKGRIEIGSVGENSTVGLAEVEQGWDLDYDGVTKFRDISLAFAAFIGNSRENTGDVRVQGKNISLTEGSQIGVANNAGQAGNVSIIASESLTIDGNGAEVGLGNFSSNIFNQILGQASGENSQLTIETPLLSITNGGQINATNVNSIGDGVDIVISASEISLNGAIDFDVDESVTTGIFAQTFAEATGDGSMISVEAEKLTVANGAQINSETFGTGNAGDIVINASESVELIGDNIDANAPSALFANIGKIDTAQGNSGNITVDTSRLIVRDGAQIASVNQLQGTGGDITINATESILLSGIASATELNLGRTGITISAAQPLELESGELIPTVGEAGNMNIFTRNLIIERGAAINANTFSLSDGGDIAINVDRLTIGSGGQISAGSLLADNAIDNSLGQAGNINITAADSVSIVGTGDINGEPTISKISTIAQGTGDAGNVTLATGDLTIGNGGEIDASATGNEAAGNLSVDAKTVSLDRGNIRAVTTAGEGGNIRLTIADNLTLRNESQISAEAVGNANGGNIDIDTNLIVAFPNQPDGSDIVASAEQGTGGNINITAESLFGISQNEAVADNGTNDIDASSRFGLDGSVSIRILDVESIQEMTELPNSLTEGEQTATQACQSQLSNRPNTLTINGKGGIERQPVESLDSDLIAIGQYEAVAPQKSQSNRVRSFQTRQGEITPAQGVAVTKDGQIILTSSVSKDGARNFTNFKNCI